MKNSHCATGIHKLEAENYWHCEIPILVFAKSLLGVGEAATAEVLSGG